jgi:hypothetical protein
MKMTDKTSNILYYSGLILLAIGAFGLTFAAFFAIIGLPVFIVGIILTLVSLKRTWKQRLIPIGIFIIGIIAFWPIWRAINTVGPETFLIPENYQGQVNIIFKKGCGTEMQKTDEGIVYKIPNDGILIIDNDLKTGFIEHSYFYVDKEGKRTEIPKMDVRDFNEEWTLEKNPNEPPRDKLGIFHWGRTGSIGSIINDKGEVTNKFEQYDFLEFYVSTYTDLTEKFGFKYEQKFDSIKTEKLKICR